MGGACIGEMGNTHRVLIGKRHGKRPLGRPKRRWQNNIKMDRKVGAWTGFILRAGTVGGLLWTQLVGSCEHSWWALVNTVINSRVPKNCGEFLLFRFADELFASQGLSCTEWVALSVLVSCRVVSCRGTVWTVLALKANHQHRHTTAMSTSSHYVSKKLTSTELWPANNISCLHLAKYSHAPHNDGPHIRRWVPQHYYIILYIQHGVEENIWTEEGRGNGGMETA